MLRYLLVDLDGVIRQWDPQPVIDLEQRHGLSTGSIAEAAFGDHTLLDRAITGQITDEEWRAKVTERLVPLCGPGASAVVAEWSASVGAVDPEALRVIRAARRAGWCVGLLSNATTRLHRDLTRLRLLEEFDAVFSSADLGMAKPNSAVFQVACRRLGVDPDMCVFVDDSATNVVGATDAGLRAHLFEDVDWLARLLGVDPAAG